MATRGTQQNPMSTTYGQERLGKKDRDFGISAAIIGAVATAASTAVSAAGASAQSREAEAEAAKSRSFTASENEKDRELKRHEQKLVGLERLAKERERIGQSARTSTFANDLMSLASAKAPRATASTPTRMGRQFKGGM